MTLALVSCPVTDTAVLLTLVSLTLSTHTHAVSGSFHVVAWLRAAAACVAVRDYRSSPSSTLPRITRRSSAPTTLGNSAFLSPPAILPRPHWPQIWQLWMHYFALGDVIVSENERASQVTEQGEGAYS